MVDPVAVQFARESSLSLSGVVIPEEPGVITPTIRQAIVEKRFEAAEARQISQIVEAGDRVIEIGAGIGYISTLLARERRVASVLAIEANPHLLDYMTRLHRRNNVRKVRRMSAVLTNAARDTMTFYLRADFWMGSLMPGPNPYLATVEVPTVNFDALLRAEAANLIVCDVEGAETFLFDGADLSGVDRVFVELHDHVTGLTGVGRVFASLAAEGLVYDPRHSCGAVVLFRRPSRPDIPRPYRG